MRRAHAPAPASRTGRPCVQVSRPTLVREEKNAGRKNSSLLDEMMGGSVLLKSMSKRRDDVAAPGYEPAARAPTSSPGGFRLPGAPARVGVSMGVVRARLTKKSWAMTADETVRRLGNRRKSFPKLIKHCVSMK